MTDNLFPETVAEARERIFDPEHFEAGIECPCCDRLVKLYRRRLNAGMAAILCWLVKESGDDAEWVDVHAVGPRFALRSNEVSRLKHWKLAEPKPNDGNPEKRDSGLWRPTLLGRLFTLGAVKVPTHALIYNGQLYGHSAVDIGIRSALEGGPFNYEELMGP